jgi:hypothetical protein
MNALVEHTKKSLTGAQILESNIAPEALSLEGMSGLMTRHFYNNLCSLEGARYLEIGTFRGSTVCSAISNNTTKTVCIDDFSEFAGIDNRNHPREDLLQNIDRFKGNNDVTFIESSCWDIDPSGLGKFNIYMYDGNHDELSHMRALSHFAECLDDEFIYIVDDWNWPAVPKATCKSLKENGLEILFKKEITYRDDQNPDGIINRQTWWNGIGIFVLKKNGT